MEDYARFGSLHYSYHEKNCDMRRPVNKQNSILQDEDKTARLCKTV